MHCRMSSILALCPLDCNHRMCFWTYINVSYGTNLAMRKNPLLYMYKQEKRGLPSCSVTFQEYVVIMDKAGQSRGSFILYLC